MAVVMIGIDPHKASHTAFALDPDEIKLGQIRVRACSTKVQNLRSWAASWPARVWAIEGATGLGRLLTQQLLAAGERVLDVQPMLVARVRLLNIGTVNKNDPNDARSVAVAALRSPHVHPAAVEDHASRREPCLAWSMGARPGLANRTPKPSKHCSFRSLLAESAKSVV